ncbi:hypothetical protein HDU98_008026 [Podochytrium sp. JEL0797]|nr:hypothetical protein HDU98_008026 [Podochytrium sp. JEL0797]
MDMHIPKKAIIPAIRKVLNDSLESSAPASKIPVVIKFRDGTRTKLLVDPDTHLVRVVREKLVQKYGKVKGNEMSFFSHGAKRAANGEEEVDGISDKATSHLPIRLDSVEFMGLIASDIFDANGGLIFVE